jgi:PUA domain protein
MNSKSFLKSKESKLLLRNFLSKYGLPENFFKGKAKVEALKVKGDKRLFFIENKPLLFAVNEELYPTLIFFEVLTCLPKIIVDMGAIPHICNGADIMAPGIRKVEGIFKKNSTVLVVDEKYGKAIAIGLALINSEDIEKSKKGKCVKNLHYVGDEIWKLFS